MQPCRTLASQAACCCDLAASEAKPWSREAGRRERRVEAGPLAAQVGHRRSRSAHQTTVCAVGDSQARGGQRGRPPLQLAGLGGVVGGWRAAAATPEHVEAAIVMQRPQWSSMPRAAALPPLSLPPAGAATFSGPQHSGHKVAWQCHRCSNAHAFRLEHGLAGAVDPCNTRWTTTARTGRQHGGKWAPPALQCCCCAPVSIKAATEHPP